MWTLRPLPSTDKIEKGFIFCLLIKTFAGLSPLLDIGQSLQRFVNARTRAHRPMDKRELVSTA